MNAIRLLLVFAFAGLSVNVLAYGSSSSTKSCTKPKFSEFFPIHLSTVAQGAEFSFLASSLTDPKTLEVSVKKQPVEISIKKSGKGYQVKGKLPKSLENTHARISIKATGTNKCKGSDGWLLKIE